MVLNQRALATAALAVLTLALCAAGIRGAGRQIMPGGGPVQGPQNVRPMTNMPVGGGAITGVVTAADTGRPLASARVLLSGTAMIAVSGRSAGPTNADGGRSYFVEGPAPDVAASLTRATSFSRSAVTDAQGQFTIDHLPPGRFTLSVNRDQFLNASYGQKQYGQPGTAVTLGESQKVVLKIPMTHAGAISGSVTGENGEPLVNAQVRIYRYIYTNGIRTLSQTNGASSDDRGQFRVFGLQPADYLVASVPNSNDLLQLERSLADAAALDQAIADAVRAAGPGRPAPTSVQYPLAIGQQMPGVVPSFFPGTTSAASALPVSLGPGEERMGIDIRVRIVRTSNIEGTITGFTGPATNIQISTQPSDPRDDVATNSSTRPSPDGKFTLRNLSPGQYIVSAQSVAMMQQTVVNGVPMVPAQPGNLPMEDTQKLWGRATVAVDGQPTIPVTIQLQPARSISGQVNFEMARPPDPARARGNITLEQRPVGRPPMMSGPAVQAALGTDGRFTIAGVMPGRYTLAVPYGPVQSEIVNGQDILDFPLEFTGDDDVKNVVITVSDRVRNLTGVLTDASGQTVSDYTIVLAPSDSKYWTPRSRRIATRRTGPDGRYSFTALPPGSYFLAALTTFENGQQYDPEFLKALTNASVAVLITEGAGQTQDLRVGR